jgi:autotransporter-associated beta strand protein
VLGGQNFAGPVGPDVFVNGDSVTFNDNNNGHYLVDVIENVSPSAVLVNSAGSYSITGAGAIGGSGGLVKSGSGTLILGTTNTFSGDTTVSAGTLTLSGVVASTNVNVNGSSAHLVVTSSGTISPTSNLSIAGSGASIAPASGSGIRPRALNSVTITGGGSLVLQAAASTPQRTVLSVASLTLTGSKLDLANNDLIITGTSATTIAGYIGSAFNSGSWTGNGLTSLIAQADSTSLHKTAVAYATASSIGVTAFDGQNVAGSNVLVRFTYSGDANLDGAVNALDFNALASHFSSGAAIPWSSGDFNFDGFVNSLDFTSLAANFNLTLPAASSSLGGLVPEPSLAAMLLLIGSPPWRRRGTPRVFASTV